MGRAGCAVVYNARKQIRGQQSTPRVCCCAVQATHLAMPLTHPLMHPSLLLCPQVVGPNGQVARWGYAGVAATPASRQARDVAGERLQVCAREGVGNRHQAVR